MATNSYISLYIKLALFIATSFFIFGYLQIKADTNLLEHLLNKQASKQAEVLATGSLDDLLSKDYGDMEQWVRAAAAGDEYAYAYILSPKGLVIIHSDLSLAGTTKNARPSKDIQYIEKIFNNKSVTEVIYPILLEDKFIGTSHVAYYPRYRNMTTQQHNWDMISLYIFLYLIIISGGYAILRAANK